MQAAVAGLHEQTNIMKTLISLEMPDDAVQRSEWLEQQLVGLRLGELVEQLAVLLDVKSESDPSLVEICGDRLGDLVAQGLSVLSADQIQQLICHPQRLLELQEKVLTEGGDYWSRVPLTEEHTKLVQSHWQSLAPQLVDAGFAPQTKVAEGSTIRPLPPARWLRVSLSLVAAMLLISVGWWFMDPPGPKWGWDRPGALAIKVPAKDYLIHLADAAEEWTNQRPATEAELDLRLGEFIHGCRTLIAAKHPQLSKDDRIWLQGKCIDWAAKLERSRYELRSGKQSVDQALKAADTTIENLVAALRKKAAEIEARPSDGSAVV